MTSAFEISLISADGKQTRTVIEHGAIKALRTALSTFDEPQQSFALTCRLLATLPDLLEDEPCAA